VPGSGPFSSLVIRLVRAAHHLPILFRLSSFGQWEQLIVAGLTRSDACASLSDFLSRFHIIFRQSILGAGACLSGNDLHYPSPGRTKKWTSRRPRFCELASIGSVTWSWHNTVIESLAAAFTRHRITRVAVFAGNNTLASRNVLESCGSRQEVIQILWCAYRMVTLARPPSRCMLTRCLLSYWRYESPTIIKTPQGGPGTSRNLTPSQSPLAAFGSRLARREFFPRHPYAGRRPKAFHPFADAF